MCATGGTSCTNAGPELRLTTDRAGNALVPMDYTGVLLRQNGVPVAQIARAATEFEAFAGGGIPVDLPGDGFLRSYSPEGVILPPVFTPLSDPSSGEATLFGSVDAPRGVIRVPRRGCLAPSGEDDEGEVCSANSECSSNQCSGALFELRDRYAGGGVGPVLVPGERYSATLDFPVPLEGLIDGDEAFAFVLSEAVPPAGGVVASRNLDSDATDFVATLRDRETGQLQAIGQSASEGRAVVRVRKPPFFSFPAVETQGELLVFLESEPAEDETDANANGSVFDSVLRAFRLGEPGEITGGTVTAEAAPLVNGRSFAVSNGRVFFRTAEAAEADQVIRMVSVDSDGVQPTGANAGTSHYPWLSESGRFVTFESQAKQLDPADANLIQDVFVHDRDLDADGVFDEPGQIRTTRLSVDSAEVEADSQSEAAFVTPTGRFVVFESDASNLVPDDGNIWGDVFLRDRDPDQDGIFDEADATTERVSLTDDELDPNDESSLPQVTPDGRYVTFTSLASNLVVGDTNYPVADTFVRDRAAGTTARVSLTTDGNQAVGLSIGSDGSALSADGRYVLFQSFAPLRPGELDVLGDCFVRDRDTNADGTLDDATATTSAVDVTTFGEPADDGGGTVSAWMGFTPDGRFAAFDSLSNLTAGDNVGWDVFVHDRDTDGDGIYGEALPGRVPEIATTRVSVSSAGAQSEVQSHRASVSADGRSVAFDSAGLVPADNTSIRDVYRHETVTGHTLRVAPPGTEGDSDSGWARISADGRYVAFESNATNLVGGDTNGYPDIFVHGPDSQDPDLPTKDRTGDGVLDDTVLRVLDTTVEPPATVSDLCPAEAVAVAAGRAAFLRPEAAGAVTDGSSACSTGGLVGPELNGDSDQTDLVVHLTDGSAVTNLRCAATAVALSATRVAALVSEAAQGAGGTDLNGDGDETDRVLFVRGVADAAPPACTGVGSNWVNTQQAADSIALSGDRVVLLTREADQNGTILNGDGDALDRVIRLVDGATGLLVPIVGSPQAAEEFVVGTDLVAFRTREAAQGQVLNGDGDQADDVLQLYVLATGQLVNTGQAVLPCPYVACDPERPYRVSASTVRFLTVEADQDDDLNDDGDQDDVLVQVYNVASGEARVVSEVEDPFAPEASDPATAVDPLVAPEPESGQPAPGEQVLVATGRCVSDTLVACTVSPPTCAAGSFCYAAIGNDGTCVEDAGQSCFPDRPPGEQGCSGDAVCVEDFVVIGVADADGDEVPDALDNCPEIPNVDQADLDQDGVGDLCDAQTCSDGVTQLAEQCDDADLQDGDGCDSNCRITACGNGIRTGPEQCDDGNALALDGCTAACEIEVADSWVFLGTATGGSVSFQLAGVQFTVTTFAGQSAGQVAASVVAAIRAHPTLAGLAVYAAAQGGGVVSNAAITNRVIADAGLGAAPAVPALGGAALVALALCLALAGALRLRRVARVR
jgi:cysteine-rich repeat protein